MEQFLSFIYAIMLISKIIKSYGKGEGSRKNITGCFFYLEEKVRIMTDKQFIESKCSKCIWLKRINEEKMYCPFNRCFISKNKKTG